MILRFEAWPTRMFATYTIWAIYEDGRTLQVGHGLPQYCAAKVERLNAQIGRANPAAPELAPV